MTEVVRFHITIPADVADRLKTAAGREHRPLTMHIRRIIEQADAAALESSGASPADDPRTAVSHQGARS